MDRIKVCFVGVGSIAKRHIANLSAICEIRKIELTIDVLRRNKKNVEENLNKYVNAVYTDIEKMPKNYDIIFLTNPTEFHLDMLRKMHDYGKHFFIEKPLTSYHKMRDVFDIKYRDSSIYYVACPLRYNSVIQYLKRNLDISKVISVRCICSSYLPNWRPNTDYRKVYSANKELGGGVSIDLIHEWDYLKFLFGNPENVFYTYGKKSLLELWCEDYAVYVAEYKNMILELHLDYFGRKTIREIMVFTDRETIVGDLVKNQVSYLCAEKKINLTEEKNDFYKKELNHFLSIVEGNAKCDNGIFNAYQTLMLTQGEIR